LNQSKQQIVGVTGIGTGVGKTFVSALLCAAWGFDYWKMVQTGIDLDESSGGEGDQGRYDQDEISDSHFVKHVAGLLERKIFVHPEAIVLKEPASPHLAADKAGVSLEQIKFVPPQITPDSSGLLIEGAGGVLVPIDRNRFVIDELAALSDAIIVVVRGYLGCINHTFLTLEYLRRNIKLPIGLVLNGVSPEVRATLMWYDLPLIAEIDEYDEFTLNSDLSTKNKLSEAIKNVKSATLKDLLK
jgi:dethiobiotin synthetase